MALYFGCVGIVALLGTFVWLVRSGSLDEIQRECDWQQITRSSTTRERRKIADASRGGSKWA